MCSIECLGRVPLQQRLHLPHQLGTPLPIHPIHKPIQHSNRIQLFPIHPFEPVSASPSYVRQNALQISTQIACPLGLTNGVRRGRVERLLGTFGEECDQCIGTLEDFGEEGVGGGFGGC